MRFRVAESLGRLGETNSEIIAVLIEALSRARDWEIRCDSARLLSQIGQENKAVIDVLWDKLLDEDNDVRSTCSQALVQLSKQQSSKAQELEARLLQAIADPSFEKPDKYEHRPASDYAYEALWLLVVGEENEEGEEGV